VIIWGKVQTPDVAASAEQDESEAFEAIEIIVEKIEPYLAPAGGITPRGDKEERGSPERESPAPQRSPTRLADLTAQDMERAPQLGQQPVETQPAQPAMPPIPESNMQEQASKRLRPTLRRVAELPDADLSDAGQAADDSVLQGEAGSAADPTSVLDEMGKGLGMITWSVDLSQADAAALKLLASTLENTEGEQEVRMLLKDVGGQLRQIRVGQRFFIDAQQAEAIEQQFGFLERIQRGQPQA
jgi:hypothetical protein